MNVFVNKCALIIRGLHIFDVSRTQKKGLFERAPGTYKRSQMAWGS